GVAKLLEELPASPESELPPSATARPGALSTRPSTAWGTVAYMSPEQARGEAVDARTDLYSFGATLYHMLTGRLPIDDGAPNAMVEAILHAPPLAPSKANPRLGSVWDQIVLKALEKDRQLRYRSASEMEADLQRLKRRQHLGAVVRRYAVSAGVLFAFAA